MINPNTIWLPETIKEAHELMNELDWETICRSYLGPSCPNTELKSCLLWYYSSDLQIKRDRIKKIQFIKKSWTRHDVESDPEYLYIFTDNLERSSGSNLIKFQSHYTKDYGSSKKLYYPGFSQATIRGLGNAYPITTMMDSKKSQIKDQYLELLEPVWAKEFDDIMKAYKYYKGIKCSIRQFGNGYFSKMITEAPKAWQRLSWYLWELGIDNREETLKHVIV